MGRKINSEQELTEEVLSVSETPHVAERVSEAMEALKSAIPSSHELADNPVEAVPTIQSHDPRIQAIQNDGDDMKIRISRVNIPAPMQPTHGSRDISGVAAMTLSKAIQELRGKLNKTARSSWDKIISYVECTDSDCLGPGIWIKGDPRIELTSDNWWSSYKTPGSYWPPNTAPHCQCCEARWGVRRKLRVDHISRGAPGPEQRRVGLVANQRFIRSITEAEYNALFQPAQQTA